MKSKTKIAVRSLKTESDAQVVIELFIPTPSEKFGWKCEFSIAGLPDGELQCAYGVDQFNALVNALEGIRLFLRPHEEDLNWEFGEQGDLGFPRVLLNGLGIKFTKRLSELVDNEIDAHVEELRIKAERKGLL